MRNLVQHAGDLSLKEHQADRSVAILFPDGTWGACAFEMGRPPIGIYLRFADQPSSLISLLVDTLITICDNEGMDKVELLTCRHRLRSSKNPKWIRIRRNFEDEVFEGRDIVECDL